jgi:peptidoglycan/LPS O-acetylase OafA/YrhL
MKRARRRAALQKRKERIERDYRQGGDWLRGFAPLGPLLQHIHKRLRSDLQPGLRAVLVGREAWRVTNRCT